MDVSARQAREWVTLFPRHPVFWLIVSIGLVFVVARRTQPPDPTAGLGSAPNASQPAPLDRAARAAQYGWLSQRDRAAYQALIERVAPPPGFRRVDAPSGSFADWLRHLPCRPADSPVLDGRGRTIRPADDPTLALVLQLQPSRAGLLNAANMVYRLRAEYLWAMQKLDAARFTMTSGAECPWARFAAGERPIVKGRDVTWKPGRPAGGGREPYVGYLETLFKYSSSISLDRDMRRVTGGAVEPGDAFVRVGRPGHAMIVLDVAVDESGQRRMMLGQGGTPPMTLHVLRGADGSPWIAWDGASTLHVPPAPPMPASTWRRWSDE
ncbi:MAG: hypothetical protein HUU22_11355 [Phycisphaerae bacterium]|nr:DUF4846 domain-containing protein [Phycisphaerae bacterium]NUQ46619.1 hypothetical protein [Phycisphaerae bacterium]